MADLTTLLDALEAYLVASLPSDRYQQNDLVEVWHHAAHPLVLDGEADPLAHLALLVALGDAVYTTGGRRSGETQVRARVEVSYLYRIRHDAQVVDLRQSIRAARDVVSAVSDPSRWAPGLVDVVPQTRYTSQLVPDEPYVLCVTSYDLYLDEESSPP